MSDILTANDIQKIFSVGRKRAYEIMHISSFPSFYVGSKIYVTRDSLDKWVQSLEGRGQII